MSIPSSSSISVQAVNASCVVTTSEKAMNSETSFRGRPETAEESAVVHNVRMHSGMASGIFPPGVQTFCANWMRFCRQSVRYFSSLPEIL